MQLEGDAVLVNSDNLARGIDGQGLGIDAPRNIDRCDCAARCRESRVEKALILAANAFLVKPDDLARGVDGRGVGTNRVPRNSRGYINRCDGAVDGAKEAVLWTLDRVLGVAGVIVVVIPDDLARGVD
jgi:hypothetical protein